MTDQRPEPTPPPKPAADTRVQPVPAKVKKPWHPPRFITTDMASTDVVGNAGRDGGPMGSLS